MKNYFADRFAVRGFTLMELLVTLAIMALLLALAMPSFKSSIDSNRRTTYANQLVEDLNLARSEAIKRNKKVVVCASSGGTSCITAPGAPSDWTVGWIVYVPTAATGTFTPGDLILRVHEALKLPAGWAATHNHSPFTVSFAPTGEITGMGGVGFRICIIQSSVLCNGSIANDVQYSNVVATTVGRIRIESQ